MITNLMNAIPVASSSLFGVIHALMLSLPERLMDLIVCAGCIG